MTDALEIRPLSGAIGAEVLGVDLSRDPSAATVAEIRRAWLEHLVIFFREQELSAERFLGVARLFGKPVEYPFIKGIDGFPEVTPVVKLEHEKNNFGGIWHSDTTYLETPPMGTMLIAREVPPYGGDTLFANQYLAYETLVRGDAADPRRARRRQHFGEGRCVAARARTASATARARTPRRATSPSIRSCARIRRPGRKALYVNSGTRRASSA